MSRLREAGGRAYAWVFARRARWAQAVNHVLLHLALRGKGYNNGWELDRSGEAWFLQFALTWHGWSSGRTPGYYENLLVVDVGANVGTYSRLALELGASSVRAYEPLAACGPQLEELAEAFQGQFHYAHAAVGDRSARRKLHYSDEHTEWASLSRALPAYAAQVVDREEMVDVVTLDHELMLSSVRTDGPPLYAKVAVLKIDVEGWESEVLAGAQQLIKYQPPRWIQIEMNTHQLLRGHTLLSLSEQLPGYRPYRLLPGRRGMVPVDPSRAEDNMFFYGNIVFRRIAPAPGESSFQPGGPW